MANIYDRDYTDSEYGGLATPRVSGAQSGSSWPYVAIGIAPGSQSHGDYSVDEARTMIGDYYNKYLGRTGSESEIAGHLQNQGWKPGSRYVGQKGLQYVLNAIANSPESKTYNKFGTDAPGGGSPSGSGGAGGGSYGGGSGYYGGGGEEPWLDMDALFDDPASAWFMEILNNRVGALGRPLSLPGVDQFKSAVQNRMIDLNGPLNIPELDEYQASLRQRSGELRNPSAPNPWLEDLYKYGGERMTELKGEPFTATEERAQEVDAYDQLERDRTSARQQVMERLAARGIGAGSGVIESALQEVDRRFDQIKAERANELLLYRTDERQRRRGEAFELGGTLAGLKQGEIDRAELREQQVLDVMSQLSASGMQETLLNEARAADIVNLAEALANMDISVFGLEDARSREQVATAAMLPDMVERRLQLALAALNGGTTSLAPLGSNLMGYMNQSIGARASAPRTDWGNLFTGAGALLGAFSNFGKK